MTTKQNTSVKRKLKDIDFSSDTSHIALVSKTQGGPANGADKILLRKATNTVELNKMQEVRVTMSTPEFLERFFDVWGTNAEVLARMIGWVPEDETNEPPDDYEDWRESFIQERLDSYEIMKSLNESDDIEDAIEALSTDDLLKLHKDQALIEKAWRKQVRLEKKALKESATKVTEGSTGAVEKSKEPAKQDKALPSVESLTTLEKSKMDKDVVQLQKALDDQAVQLQKAMDTLAAYEAEKKENILKSKVAQIAAVMDNEKDAEVIAKAALTLNDTEFTAFVEVIKGLNAKVEKSALFQEQGVSTQGTNVTSSADKVSSLLKAQFAVK